MAQVIVDESVRKRGWDPEESRVSRAWWLWPSGRRYVWVLLFPPVHVVILTPEGGGPGAGAFGS